MSYGRRKIFTDEAEITAENVVKEVNAAYLVHLENRNEIITLYQYYRNKTAIEDKKKEVRENINFKIGEARCLEVTNFYKGYLFGEPIQYVRREKSQNSTPDDVIAADINALNSCMSDANKASCDSTLGKWMLVAGTGYKMALPNKRWQKNGDEPPFNVYAPDPRRTFVVYNNDVDESPVMNVTYSQQKNGDVLFTVYTPSRVFKYKYGHSAPSVEANPLGMLPIIEYPAADYLGIFEPVVPLVDALNALQSNRLDDVAQYINSFLAIVFDKEVFQSGEKASGGHYISEGGPAPALRTTGHPPGVCVAGVDCRNMNEYPDLYPTLQAKPNGGQSLNFSGAVRDRYIVRRLTPTECARLQGFPDRWGHPKKKEDLTDEEYRFWLDVRNTHAVINVKAVKEYTKDQMLKWYSNLHSDSAEYKMRGNGIALPPTLYCMQGIAEALKKKMLFIAAGVCVVCYFALQERQRIGFAVKIHVQRSTAVTGNGHGFILAGIADGEVDLISRKIIFIICAFYRISGSSLFGDIASVSIIGVIWVLVPVNHGDRRFGRSPCGCIAGIFRWNRCGQLGTPTGKGVARLLRRQTIRIDGRIIAGEKRLGTVAAIQSQRNTIIISVIIDVDNGTAVRRDHDLGVVKQYVKSLIVLLQIAANVGFRGTHLGDDVIHSIVVVVNVLQMMDHLEVHAAGRVGDRKCFGTLDVKNIRSNDVDVRFIATNFRALNIQNIVFAGHQTDGPRLRCRFAVFEFILNDDRIADLFRLIRLCFRLVGFVGRIVHHQQGRRGHNGAFRQTDGNALADAAGGAVGGDAADVGEILRISHVSEHGRRDN